MRSAAAGKIADSASADSATQTFIQDFMGLSSFSLSLFPANPPQRANRLEGIVNELISSCQDLFAKY